MRRLLVIAIACAIEIAHAAPRSTRVVLVDPDPELLRAMTTALRPWKLEVIVDATPVDAAGATARADALRARFVVWRDGAELVVFDRERGDAQHRDVATGSLDAVDAASAALSVKTLMRLPPPEEMERPAPATKTELRVQAGAATRFSSQASARLVGAVMVKPIAMLRVGVVGDLGTRDTFKEANIAGSWSDWSVLAIASWTLPLRSFELEPWLAGGVTRSRVIAEPMGMGATIDDRTTLVNLRVGASLRYRLGMFTLGAIVGVEGRAGTPTYTRDPNDKLLYEVPSTGLTLGIIGAADLGR